MRAWDLGSAGHPLALHCHVPSWVTSGWHQLRGPGDAAVTNGRGLPAHAKVPLCTDMLRTGARLCSLPSLRADKGFTSRITPANCGLALKGPS